MNNTHSHYKMILSRLEVSPLFCCFLKMYNNLQSSSDNM